ncbi:MAG: hypothetical protein ACREHD_02595, partial [Pirellulales bacterium]
HGHDAGHAMPGMPTCHGPGCQKQAPLPALPTKGLMNLPPVDLALWSLADATSPPSLCGAVFERRVSLSEGHSLPLLRPPCL